MTVAEAVAALGIPDIEDGVLVFARKGATGGMRHYLYDDIATKAVPDNLYLASGWFKPDAITETSGRSAPNLVRLIWLPFDFDLVSFSGIPVAQLHGMPDAALAPWISALVERVRTVFDHLRLPIHRLDYTGYGVAAYINLPAHKTNDIPRIQQLHKAIVRKINEIAGEQLADPQVSDAGTRIMRLVPTLNTKRPDMPRQTAILIHERGTVTEEQLTYAAGEIIAPPTRLVPETGSLLDGETMTKIVQALGPHWTEGNRHGVSLALGALFAKAGVPEEQCVAIVETLASGDTEFQDRVKAVHTSYERVRTGLPVRGFYGLNDFLPPELAMWLDGIASKVRAATTPRITIGGHALPQNDSAGRRATQSHAIDARFVEPPDSAFVGLVKSYVDLVLPCSEAPAAFHLGVALTGFGQMIQRHVHTVYASDPLYPNLYTILVGRSNTKKDSAIKRFTRSITSPMGSETSIINHGIMVTTDVASSTALINDLKENRNRLLYFTELSRLNSNRSRKGSEGITTALMEAFDCPPYMQNKSMGNNIEAEFPFAGMLAGVQPEILSGIMSDNDMNSGFANRLFYVCGRITAPMASPPELDRRALMGVLRDVWSRRQSYAAGTGLRLTPDARVLWDQWYERDWYADADTPEEENLRKRHHVLIQKIALIYAVCDGDQAISAEHLTRAIQIVEWMWHNIALLTGMWGRTTDGQIEQRIRDVLSSGPMKRRELQQKCSSRRWGSPEFTRVFESLKLNGVLDQDPTGMVDLAG